MLRTCPHCRKEFDDAQKDTGCPHDLIMPLEDLARKDAAIKLIGKRLLFAHKPKGVAPTRVQSISWNGMVTVEGFSGQFAPELFVVVEEPI